MTLRWVPGWNGLTDPDAVSYVAAVEAADGQDLEFGVARAINDFVVGCKNDGIWDAIKASCILAGARTLAGALVPLVGTAPTNYNFVAGDYYRETGLKGDGSTKYLDSNRNNNADPQNSKHISVYASDWGSISGGFIGSDSTGTGHSHLYGTGVKYFRLHTATFYSYAPATTAPFMGASRYSSAEYDVRINNLNLVAPRTSEPPSATAIKVFRTVNYSNARLSFYSVGESLDLAALDTRVSNLITAIGAAIP